jgi:pSer/pThr/pTyr-binding forkhead associated (FHA) protein
MVALSADLLTIGRAPTNELAIASAKVSRLHAVLERFPSGWSIRDLGSTNGTTVNGAALRQSQLLHDGDQIEIGPARIVFRAPDLQLTKTVTADPPPAPPHLTRRERDVVDALCRPFVEGGGAFPEPPPVKRLAAELSLSESAVKKHLANLYDKFDLRTNDERRRSHLAGEAVRRGAVRT